jgi:glucan phosphoethanolaminetransferase (alkaline phosphatase superfamily)
MLQKLRNHLLLALCFFILTLAQQYGFYAYKNLPIIWFTPGKYFAIFAFLLVLSFARGWWIRFLLLSFVMILNLGQMSHLSYFGTQVLPNEMYLLFTQAHEIAGTLFTELEHVVIPLLFTVIPLTLGWFAQKKLKPLYGWRAIGVLFLLYFIYNPARTYFTGNTWGRQPSTRELAGMNIYLSTSYFLGKILPHKLSAQKDYEPNTSLLLEVKVKEESPWENIIVVQGESLSPHHMELFGYEKPTTPYLSSLITNKDFFHTSGLSSGVSTDISVAFFLNLGFGSAGSLKAAKGEHCLFKLAQAQKFETHFLSIQSSEQLRYIAPYLCAAALDDYRSLEQISPLTQDSNAAIDRHLLPALADILKKSGKQFIMLHQRGSHAPWALRATPKAQKFSGSTEEELRIAHYDNSVVEFDLFWKELNEVVEKSGEKTLIVYLSDHGEALGQGGKWGHGFLDPLAFEIPIMIQSFHQNLPLKTRSLPVNLPQYNLSLYILEQLGFEPNQKPQTILQDYEIYGNDIDGFAGKVRVKFGLLNDYRIEATP